MLMNEPKVSVVMAVYNGERYLAAAVESILRQSFSDFEFVIVDDGSTDGTPAMLNAWAAQDSRVVLVHNETNRGMAASLNRGLAAARGAYVARQDADDLSEPTRLAEQVPVLDARPEVGLVSCWVNLIDGAGQPLAYHPFPDLAGNTQIQAALLAADCLCHGSVMFRRKLVEQLGSYDEQLEGTEDYDLWLRFAEVTQFEEVPQYLYRYRSHPSAFSEARRAYQAWQQARTVEKMAARRFGPPPQPAIYRSVAREFLMAAEISLREGDRPAHEERLAHAIQLCPALFAERETFVPLPPLPDSLSVLERVFSRLPATPPFRRLLRQLQAREHMRAVFAGAGQGQPASLEQHLWPAIRQDPGWLINRGVVALLARGLTQRLRHPAGQVTGPAKPKS